MKHLSKLTLILLVALASTQPAVAKEKQKAIYLLCEYSTVTNSEGETKPDSWHETLKVSVRDGWKITENEYFFEKEHLEQSYEVGPKTLNTHSWKIDRLSGDIRLTMKQSDDLRGTSFIFFRGQCKKADKPKL